MSDFISIPTTLLKDLRVCDSAILLYARILALSESFRVLYSPTYFAEMHRCSRRSAAKYIKLLVELKYLEINEFNEILILPISISS